jgi:hypothetical protein
MGVLEFDGCPRIRINRIQRINMGVHELSTLIWVSTNCCALIWVSTNFHVNMGVHEFSSTNFHHELGVLEFELIEFNELIWVSTNC